MRYDGHTHSAFSADSEMRAEDALARAEQLGLGLVFTEHLDLDYPGDKDFVFDPEDYWNTYSPLRGERLLLGVEIGMTPEHREANRAFASRVPFDMILGSIHMVDGMDLYYPETYRGREKGEFYREYLISMAREVYHNEFIDVLAHIDYIARYADFENPELKYGDFPEEVDAVLGALIVTDTVLELNTRRCSDASVLKALLPIYKRYREMGGRYITIGSDAHKAEALGGNFSMAWDFAEECGLKPVVFCERKMELSR